MRKQLDSRITTLIRNNVALNHRSFFVLVGDHGRDQVVNLHFLLSQCRTSSRPNVLWCYKKDLGFTTHRKKREAKIKRDIKRGIREKGDASDPFELFVSVTDIRYCYYKDTPKILGRTFGMLILQDFEAITPNLLARTIETVEGGGVVVLLLKTMTSLRQLYSVAMDVHAKYRSSFDVSDPVARFNERFLLSLSSSPSCLMLDDELNVLPISKGKDIRPIEGKAGESSTASKQNRELSKLRDELGQTRVVTDVIKHAKTLGQAKAVLTILDILAASNLSTTVALTAARGRGKSAALGLCIAAAVAHGYSNIFVTSPSPENLRTLFDFLFKGLEALGYEEVADWDLQRGTGEWKDIVLRVNIFRGHRQTIQYISPDDAHVLGQAELVVIDEAAAIPLATVRKLMGPYLVFLSSTINGYEGTGRSLSLKLIQQLRESASGSSSNAALVKSTDNGKAVGPLSSGLVRNLKEVSLSEPIRYSSGDNVETWLHQLLCLDASLTPLSFKGSSPHPSDCQLFQVNRDALFSYHPASEAFLQRMMALYVSSHYKNSPNDLQLMSDAPGHRLFVLLAPVEGASSATLPEPLCVLQVALEGNIGRQSILNSLSRGQRDAGDLIPWTMSQQFQDADFASLSGARVVRIAVHPHHAREGYGKRALDCLGKFYAGELFDADAGQTRAQDGQETFESVRDNDAGEVAIRDASRMPALLQRLSDREPEKLDWLGVTYGLTPSLYKFWQSSGYVPLHLKQTPNDITGEYTVVQMRGVDERVPRWLTAFALDFRRRFITLLGFKFRSLSAVSCLTILQGAGSGSSEESSAVEMEELRMLLSPFDMKRLEAFGNNLLDFTVILDLLPILASLYFTNRLRAPNGTSISDDAEVPEDELSRLQLSALQSAMLLAIGLQRKDPNEISTELGLPTAQALALFVKAIRRIVSCLRRVEKKHYSKDLNDTEKGKTWNAPIQQTVDQELKEAGIEEEEIRRKREEQRSLLQELDLSQYAIDDQNKDWQEAEKQARNLLVNGNGTENLNTVVSVKGPAKPVSAITTNQKRKSGDTQKANGKKKRS
jgi:N-acetyltransferase 10